MRTKHVTVPLGDRDAQPVSPRQVLDPEGMPGSCVPLPTMVAERYEVGGEMARGGMGVVLEAEDRSLRRQVAMKVMLQQAGASDDQVLRFVSEARVTGQLEHPGIVPVHELGVDPRGRVFYSMKLVRGTTLNNVLARLRKGDPEAVSKYPLNALLTIFLKVCDAMAFAHSRGVVHRDLKPDNIMIGEFGEVLVMDWGLAKVLGGPEQGERNVAGEARDVGNASLMGSPAPQESCSPDTGVGSGMTMEGQILGTPAFMAPEQARGAISMIDARSDIYSLGAILYSLLALRPPVEGRTPWEILHKVVCGKVSPPATHNRSATRSAASEPDIAEPAMAFDFLHCPGGRIPEPLSRVTMKALALAPEERYQTVPDLQADIEAWRGGFATSAEAAGLWRQLSLLIRRHRGVASAALAVVLALAMGLGLALVQWRKSVRAEAEAKHARDTAVSARAAEAELREKAERNAYVGSIARAQEMMSQRSFSLASSILAACPERFRGWEWYRLRYLCQHGIAAFQGSRTVCFLPDGKTLATGSPKPGDGAVLLVDAGTGKTLRRLEGEGEAQVVSVACSSNGRLLAGSRDGAVILWDLGSGKPLRRFHMDQGVDLVATALSRDGRRIASLARQRLWLWEADSAADGIAVEAPTGVVGLNCLAFMPDGASVVVGGSKGDAKGPKMWHIDVRSGTILKGLDIPSGSCTGLAVSPDGETLLTLAWEGEVFLVDLHTGQVRNPKGHLAKVPRKACAFADDGRQFAVGGMDLLVRLFDGKTEKRIREFEGSSKNHESISFSPDGLLLATADEAGGIVVHSVSGDPPRERVLGIGGIDNGCFTAGSGQLFLAAYGCLALVNSATGKVVPIPTVRPRPEISYGEMSRDGTRVAVSDFFGEVEVRSTEDWRVLARWQADDRQVFYVVFSPKGDLLATLGRDAVTVWRPDGTLVHSWPALLRYSCPTFTPNGRQIVTAAVKRGRLTWLDIDSGGEVASTGCGAPGKTTAVFSPDGQRLAMASGGRVVMLDARTKEPLCSLEGHVGLVRTMGFSADGRRLVTGGEDGSVRIWDAATGEQLMVVENRPAVLNWVAFSPDGRMLATAAYKDDRLILRSIGD